VRTGGGERLGLRPGRFVVRASIAPVDWEETLAAVLGLVGSEVQVGVILPGYDDGVLWAASPTIALSG
jgi:hypothetical protein